MRYNSPKFIVKIFAILILFADRCYAQQQNVEFVAQTLQTYKVGKTTIRDFIKDADLVNATFPPPYDAGSNPPPSFLLRSIYKVSAGSVWAIYETGLEEGNKYGLGFTRTRKYVVGDTNRPICILAFDKEGMLASSSPVTNVSPVPKFDFVPAQSSTPQNIEVVARTLKTYEVGKITIEDFVKDAHLERGTLMPLTYLNPEPTTSSRYTLQAPKNSPWKIYLMTLQFGLIKSGDISVTGRKYLVGDTNKPICTLGFDNNGKLTSILQEP